MRALLVATVATLLTSGCGKSGAPSVDPIETVARHACMDAIENAATNKSSVEFHSFTSPPVVRKIANGQLDVFIKFSAKNAFGSESTSIARCVLSGDGKSLVEFNVQDSR